MKKLFYAGLSGLAIFEFLKVYFIMPMPGSQQMNSITSAYVLYSYRWLFRIFFFILITAGITKVFSGQQKWVPVLFILITAGITYLFNFPMTADNMFKQPEHLVFASKGENKLDDNAIVIGVVNNGEAKAYPIRFLTYHHQVQDIIGGKKNDSHLL